MYAFSKLCWFWCFVSILFFFSPFFGASSSYVIFLDYLLKTISFGYWYWVIFLVILLAFLVWFFLWWNEGATWCSGWSGKPIVPVPGKQGQISFSLRWGKGGCCVNGDSWWRCGKGWYWARSGGFHFSFELLSEGCFEGPLSLGGLLFAWRTWPWWGWKVR